MRYTTVIVWAVGTILVGVGIGTFLIGGRQSVTSGEDPTPIATTPIRLASANPSSITIRTKNPAPPNLQPGRPSSVYQAQAGNTFQTVAITTYQPGAGQDIVQPGFLHYGLEQGNRGTDPVRE